MVWKGVIIGESLEDNSVLYMVKVLQTRKSDLKGEEEKGLWHFHSIDVADEDVDKFVEKTKTAIKKNWWIHIVNGDEMIVILKNWSMKHKKGNKKTLKQIRDYVAAQGIVQLPSEEQINNPYD